MRAARVGALAALVVAGAVASPAPARADIVDPIAPVAGTRPASTTEPPPGFTRSARDAIAIGGRLPAARAVAGPGVDAEAFVRVDPSTWVVVWWDPDTELPLLEVRLDDRTGRPVQVWEGWQAAWTTARGDEDLFGGRLYDLYIWIPLCAVFFLAFFDPRRPFRLLHLDLLVLLGLSASQAFFSAGRVGWSVPLVYPVLAYLAVRMVLAGLRPRRDDSPLVPWVPMRALAVVLVLLVAGRIALNVTDGSVIDVGYASVVGADRVAHGEELYTDNDVHGDTYGPLTYAAYVPFELAFPFEGRWDSLPAAHAAAIAFDLLTIAGLLLLGRRLRPGPDGRRLGLALAFAWAAYPFAAVSLLSDANDGLVAALLVGTLLALGSPAARGAVLGAAAAAKFGPAILLPLVAAGHGLRAPAAARTVGAFTLVAAVATVAYLPDGGVRELWNATIGFQLGRDSIFSIWGQEPGLEPLQRAVQAAAILLAAAVAFVPRRRSEAQVIALAAAVMIALQLGMTHWFYLYLVWLLPLLLPALFLEHSRVSAEKVLKESAPEVEKGAIRQGSKPLPVADS